MSPLMATLVLMVCAAGLGLVVIGWGMSTTSIDTCAPVSLQINDAGTDYTITPTIGGVVCPEKQQRISK